MLNVGLEWQLIDSHVNVANIASDPSPNPVSGNLRVYSKAVSGVSNLFVQKDDGSVVNISPANIVTGTGAANRITIWSSASVIAANVALTTGRVVFSDSNGLLLDNASLFWDNTNKRLGLGTTTPTVDLHIQPAVAAVVSQLIQSGAAGSRASLTLGRTAGDSNFALSGAAAEFSNIVIAGGETILRAATSHLVLTARNTSGAIKFATGAADTLKAQVSSLGSLVVGTGAALATNATDGFLYIPTSAGAPTGTPTTYTGRVAIEYDTTNNKLYVFNGAWKSVTLA